MDRFKSQRYSTDMSIVEGIETKMVLCITVLVMLQVTTVALAAPQNPNISQSPDVCRTGSKCDIICTAEDPGSTDITKDDADLKRGGSPWEYLFFPQHDNQPYKWTVSNQHVQESDRGIYRCKDGKHESSLELKVAIDLTISQSPAVCLKGARCDVVCSSVEEPYSPDMTKDSADFHVGNSTWEYQYTEKEGSAPYKWTFSNNNMQESDRGTYSCKDGERESSLELKLQTAVAYEQNCSADVSADESGVNPCRTPGATCTASGASQVVLCLCGSSHHHDQQDDTCISNAATANSPSWYQMLVLPVALFLLGLQV